MSEPIELLPCPFCGGNAKTQQCPAKGFRPAGTRITFQIGCASKFKDCPFQPFSGDFTFPSKEQAIAAWNTRAALPSDAWQPIESVPRNGTDILLVWADGHQQIDRMTSGESSFWYENAPIGWLPLPAPPAAKE